MAQLVLANRCLQPLGHLSTRIFPLSIRSGSPFGHFSRGYEVARVNGSGISERDPL
jgi:hypothetical protein